jgi:hypothetical protein
MTYEEFYYSIDCKFPYHSPEEWKDLINLSLDIGHDAPFLVLHEICRVPASENLDSAKHMEIYEYWKTAFIHPIQEIIEPAILSYISKEDLPDETALSIMEAVRPYKKSYNALSIVLFSCPDDEDKVDDKYEEIVAEWKVN